jgi:multidrug transporter EmrE-like cation transporter
VFFCDSQLTRSDLDIEERMRVRQIRYKVGMAPRICIVVILALGFTLAQYHGLPVKGGWLVLVWLACAGWLASILAVRILGRSPAGLRWARIDRGIWGRVGAVMVTLGGMALFTDRIVVPGWLGLKMAIYGLIVWNGIRIMRAADHWYPLIEMARRGGEERLRAEPLMKATRFWCGLSAGVLWFLVLVVGFIGKVKPL